MSGRPPSLCRTFAVDERMRVPSPAASMSMSSGGLPGCEGCCGCLSIVASARGGHDGARARLFVTREDDAGEFLRTVPNLVALVEQVRAHDLGLVAELLFEQVVGQTDLARALRGVSLRLLGADGPVVDDDEVELDFGRVAADDCEVAARSVAVGLARLRHQVADENLDRRGLSDAAGHARDEQIRKDARVER